MADRIPFNRASLTGKELEYVGQAIAQGHISGDGPFTARCQALLESELGVARALLTPSCTHALEMAAFLVDVQPGNEVIVPSFTFVSTANAFAIRGARPVFVDSRPDTLNVDETLLESRITPATRAMVVVHYAGVGCAMDAILAVAARHGVPVIEDNAHGLFGRYHGRALGSFGALAGLSFHETKNFTCGEGGALILNDQRHAARAEILREKGTNRSAFFRGQVDKYTWVDLGSSYLPADTQAAFLAAQLEHRAAIQAKRRQIWEYYATHLAGWAAARGARLPIVPPECEPAYHLFYVLMPSLYERQALIAHLAARDIAAVFHYVPLHLSPMGRRFGAAPGDHPVAEAAGERLLRLPFYNSLTEADQAWVVESVLAFR